MSCASRKFVRAATAVAALTNFLEAQDIQNPFSLDTSWLAVGHVDEFVSFVADASSPKGFKMVWTDIDMAYEILDGMSGSTSIPRDAGGSAHSVQNLVRHVDVGPHHFEAFGAGRIGYEAHKFVDVPYSEP